MPSPGWSSLLLAAGALAVLRLGRALPLPAPTTPPGRRLGHGEEGSTATLDFLLAFPFFVMILLVVVQLALMVHGRVLVSYAAFAAARSAVVWSEEGLDVAEERARRAAALALVPVARRSELPGRWILWMPRLFLATVHGGLLRDSRTAGLKGDWAYDATEVEIVGPDGDRSFGPRDPLTVTVTHQLVLDVPWADGIFQGLVGGTFRSEGTAVPVVPVSDTYTLLNEGRVRTE